MIVKLPDGRTFEYVGSATLKDVLVTTDRQLLKTVIGAKLNGEIVDFHQVLPADAHLELMSLDSPGARAIFRHSISHVLAQAVKRLFPAAKLAIGPAIDDGFYYDFDVEKPFTPEDLEKIEVEMKKIIKENFPFERSEVSREEAHQRLSEMSEPYKLELLEELPSGETISFYKDGDFVDLCRGPHILGTGQVKHFKLLNVAGAYWRGDEKKKMLQRIYGTAFYTKEELEQFLQMREEAKKRDHRKLGSELQLFTFDEEVGPGLPLWLPKGAVIIEELENLAKETEQRAGYLRVRTPHICKESMYLTSGHLPYYQSAMYPPMQLEGVKYYLKPMNCPHHHKIFGSSPKSYRDLPVRLAEYGTCYRYEQSGELFGLLRVRMLSMNDAHIYCTIEQFEKEFLDVCNMYLNYFTLFGIEKYVMRLSLHDAKGLGKKYVNEPELWKKTEDLVRRAMINGKINFIEVSDEAAFYGPKIDVQVWSAIGREFSLATNQVDFAVPRRFNLTYKNAQGTDETPLCIHRAPLGTHERFIGFLIEHYAGAFPVWLSPVQVVILPITDRHVPFAQKVLEQLQNVEVRTEMDSSNNTLNYRIRQAQLQKIPYMLVIGDREEQNEQVAVRLRTGEDLGAKGVSEFVKFISNKIEKKETNLT